MKEKVCAGLHSTHYQKNRLCFITVNQFFSVDQLEGTLATFYAPSSPLSESVVVQYRHAISRYDCSDNLLTEFTIKENRNDYFILQR